MTNLISLTDYRVKKEKDSKSSSQVFLPYTKEKFRESFKNKPGDLFTGFKFEGEDLLIPSSGLTLVASRPFHGKTSFLLNLALNMAQSSKNFSLYIPYDEPHMTINEYLLNICIDEELTTNNRQAIHSAYNNEPMDFGLREFINKCRKGFPHNIGVVAKSIAGGIDNLINNLNSLTKLGGVGAIFIDTLALLACFTYNDEILERNIFDASRKLLKWTVDKGIPVICSTRFDTTVTTKEKMHVTRIADCFEAVGMANLVIGLWNNCYNEDDNMKSDTIDAVILKSRNTKSGQEAKFNFNSNTGKITN